MTIHPPFLIPVIQNIPIQSPKVTIDKIQSFYAKLRDTRVAIQDVDIDDVYLSLYDDASDASINKILRSEKFDLAIAYYFSTRQTKLLQFLTKHPSIEIKTDSALISILKNYQDFDANDYRSLFLHPAIQTMLQFIKPDELLGFYPVFKGMWYKTPDIYLTSLKVFFICFEGNYSYLDDLLHVYISTIHLKTTLKPFFSYEVGCILAELYKQQAHTKSPSVFCEILFKIVFSVLDPTLQRSILSQDSIKQKIFHYYKDRVDELKQLVKPLVNQSVKHEENFFFPLMQSNDQLFIILDRLFFDQNQKIANTECKLEAISHEKLLDLLYTPHLLPHIDQIKDLKTSHRLCFQGIFKQVCDLVLVITKAPDKIQEFETLEIKMRFIYETITRRMTIEFAELEELYRLPIYVLISCFWFRPSLCDRFHDDGTLQSKIAELFKLKSETDLKKTAENVAISLFNEGKPSS
jgi:hypothetical protein